MKCHECGGDFQQKSDLFETEDPLVGTIRVEGFPYYKCDKNGEILFTDEMTRALDEARNNRIQILLNEYPISDFIGAAATAELLGITRQALYKNRRINRGFIYQTVFGGTTVYLKESVIQYRKTGDGRFPLRSSYRASLKNIEGAVPLH
jgi:hypothetical protein